MEFDWLEFDWLEFDWLEFDWLALDRPRPAWPGFDSKSSGLQLVPVSARAGRRGCGG